MPEHDIDDLDAAFARLESDISGTTHARGAGAAIATARRRRRTTVGAVAAATVLVAGGVALAQGVGTHHDSVGPAGLPSPAPYDNTALTAATQGWVSGWKSPTNGDEFALEGKPVNPHCLDSLQGIDEHPVTTSPTRTGGNAAVTTSDQEVAFATLAAWSDEHPGSGSAAYAAVVSSIDACAQATPSHDYTWDGARAASWDVTGSDSRAQHVWVAEQGNTFGMVWIGGSAGSVPDEVDQRVASALVAGLQAPESFPRAEPSDSQSASGSSTTALPSFDTVTEKQLQGAFGTWPSGLQIDGAVNDMPSTPCTPDSFDASSGGGAASIGSNGVQSDFDFDSPASAVAGLQETTRQWQDCTATDYSVTTVDVPGDRTVTVATSTGPKTVTNWAVQDGPYLLVLSINGGSNPPEQASAAVGALLYDVVTHPQQEGPGTIAPGKLKAVQREDPSAVASSSAAAPSR